MLLIWISCNIKRVNFHKNLRPDFFAACPDDFDGMVIQTPTTPIELLYIRTLPSHQYNLECCKIFRTKIKVKIFYTPRVSWLSIFDAFFYIKEWSHIRENPWHNQTLTTSHHSCQKTSKMKQIWSILFNRFKFSFCYCFSLATQMACILRRDSLTFSIMLGFIDKYESTLHQKPTSLIQQYSLALMELQVSYLEIHFF